MKINTIIAAILVVLTAYSCKNTEEPAPFEPFKDMVKIATAPTGSGAYKIDVYLKEDAFVGYNNLYLSVYDSASGEVASDWSASISTLMTMMTDMGTMKHTCPLEQPIYNSEMKAYEGAAMFVMPTTDMGTWQFTINYVNGNMEGELSFPIIVKEKENKAMISFVSEADQTTKFFVAIIQPELPDVGINDFEIGIYTKESMMSFPAVDDYTVVIEPEMPSMGHGSPDNVDPVSVGNGHYKGNVNFTMTGFWRVHMTITNTANQVVVEDSYFDIEF